jgi:SdpC family antimicrobial peptide
MVILSLVLLLPSCNLEQAVQSEKYSGEDYVRGFLFASGPVAKVIPELTSNYDLEYFVGDESTRNHFSQILDEIIASVDKDFLMKFKIEIESRNHFRIEKALKAARNEILQVINQNQFINEISKNITTETNKSIVQVVAKKFNGRPVSKEEMKQVLDELLTANESIENPSGRSNEVNETKIIFGAAIFAVAAIVGAVIYFLFVLEAAAFWTDVGVDWADGPVTGIEGDNEGTLLQEQLIDLIATRFGD